MNRFSRTVLPALAILILAAGSASAQTIPSPFRYIERKSSVEILGGYLFTSPTIELDSLRSAEFGPRSAPMVGARFNRRFGGPLSGDLTLSFIPSERKVISAAEGQDSIFTEPLETGDVVSAPIVMLEGGLRFHLTGDRTYRGFAPFLGVTGGLAAEVGGTAAEERALPEDERFDFGPAFALGGAAGLDVFLSQSLSLRTELSYRLWRLGVPEGFATSRNADIDVWKGNAGVSVGAAFHF
jgi:hypothetical protein